MCAPGTTTHVIVTIPAELSHTGKARQASKPIDACIAQLVQELNNVGLITTGSCCGHGKGPGAIAFADGSELTVAKARQALQELNVVGRVMSVPPVRGEDS